MSYFDFGTAMQLQKYPFFKTNIFNTYLFLISLEQMNFTVTAVPCIDGNYGAQVYGWYSQYYVTQIPIRIGSIFHYAIKL